LIRDDLEVVVPVARYLYRRVTTGLFYDLIRSKDHASRVANVIGVPRVVWTASVATFDPTSRFLRHTGLVLWLDTAGNLHKHPIITAVNVLSSPRRTRRAG